MHRTDLPSALILMALGLKEETSNEVPPPLSEVIIGSTSSDVVPEAATITAPFRPTLSTWLNVDGTVEAAADIFTCKQWTLPTSETGFGFLVKFWV